MIKDSRPSSPPAAGDTVASVTEQLETGPLYLFADWPCNAVPRASGAYTIWRGPAFLYVGIALSSSAPGDRSTSGRRTGLAARLASHASGRRSGDQFCVYVADRLVLPNLSPDDIRDIADGRLSLDAITGAFIRRHLAFRFHAASPSESRRIEALGRGGHFHIGMPLLNPLRSRASSSR